MVLGAYGKNIDDLEREIKEHIPSFDKGCIVKFDHPNSRGSCPPYFICVDHQRREIGMYIRGLNLLHRHDYVCLMSNRRGEQECDGGYVHRGMMEPAKWAVRFIAPILREELLKYSGYQLVIAGHSLGAGVAALFTLLLLQDRVVIGDIPAAQIKGYAIEPPRVMSMKLCIRNSPYIYSIIHQDDFLPRVSTSSVKRILLVTFSFTIIVLCFHWLKQALTTEKDDEFYRLYPPGRILHVVYKQPGKQHHTPVKVRVADNARGRFNRIVLSASAASSDHSILHLIRHLKTYKAAEGEEYLGLKLNLNCKGLALK
ncbi:hypothetical protein GOP47_0013286 [Adiantum capillus-veneris]|uniref:Fungal lipase-type domain-containing protein n=1 Tax=Adiantum capillus-veneris TaxID=13818 RepID=A0A9D4ZF56_ADICA|nr:hypothetical protein GOP47_0013286 [Adiantum capillus-veneris]